MAAENVHLHMRILPMWLSSYRMKTTTLTLIFLLWATSSEVDSIFASEQSEVARTKQNIKIKAHRKYTPMPQTSDVSVSNTTLKVKLPPIAENEPSHLQLKNLIVAYKKMLEKEKLKAKNNCSETRFTKLRIPILLNIWKKSSRNDEQPRLIGHEKLYGTLLISPPPPPRQPQPLPPVQTPTFPRIPPILSESTQEEIFRILIAKQQHKPAELSSQGQVFYLSKPKPLNNNQLAETDIYRQHVNASKVWPIRSNDPKKQHLIIPIDNSITLPVRENENFLAAPAPKANNAMLGLDEIKRMFWDRQMRLAKNSKFRDFEHSESVLQDQFLSNVELNIFEEDDHFDAVGVREDRTIGVPSSKSPSTSSAAAASVFMADDRRTAYLLRNPYINCIPQRRNSKVPAAVESPHDQAISPKEDVKVNGHMNSNGQDSNYKFLKKIIKKFKKKKKKKSKKKKKKEDEHSGEEEEFHHQTIPHHYGRPPFESWGQEGHSNNFGYQEPHGWGSSGSGSVLAHEIGGWFGAHPDLNDSGYYELEFVPGQIIQKFISILGIVALIIGPFFFVFLICWFTFPGGHKGSQAYIFNHRLLKLDDEDQHDGDRLHQGLLAYDNEEQFDRLNKIEVHDNIDVGSSEHYYKSEWDIRHNNLSTINLLKYIKHT